MFYHQSKLRGSPLRLPVAILIRLGLHVLLPIALILSLPLVRILVEGRLPDIALIVILAGACLFTVSWSATGARPLSKWLFVPLVVLGALPSIIILILASYRFPPLAPFWVAFVTTLAFVILGCGACWWTARPAGMPLDNVRDNTRFSAMIVTSIVCIVAGLLFFQPLAVLINGQAEGRSPLVLRGRVVNMYEVHRKQYAHYVVFSGPAAGFNSTGIAGEFEVPQDYYRNSHIGGLRCVTIHTGLLGFRWWSLDGC